MSKNAKIRPSSVLWAVLPVFITVITLLLGYVRFIVNDDVMMNRIAESFSTNAHSEHLVFISFLYGYVLKFFYNLIPSVNWFVILELAVLNAGFIALNKIVNKYDHDKLGLTVLAAAQLFFLNNLTFTSIAFVCALSGMLFFLEFVPKLNKKSIGYAAVSLVLFLLGFAMRSGSTMTFIVLLFVPVFVFALKNKRNSIAAVAVLLVICIGANYAVSGLAKAYLKTIPEDMYYTQFDEYRAGVTDSGLNSYEKHKDELEKAGVSENTYYLAGKWIYDDKKVFTPETMKTVTSVKDFNDLYDTDVLGIVKSFIKAGTPFMLLLAMLALAVFLFLSAKNSRAQTLLVFLFTGGAIAYLYFRRRGLTRVCNPVIICGIIILLCLYLQEKETVYSIKLFKRFKPKTVQRGIAALCVCIITFTEAFNVFITVRRDHFAKANNYVIEYTQEYENQYIIDGSLTNDYFLKYYNTDILKAKGDSFPFKLSLGGWTSYSYYWYDNLNNLGLSDYSDSLISVLLRDDVRYITDDVDPEAFVIFFKENYNLDVAYETENAFESSNTVVYRFYKK